MFVEQDETRQQKLEDLKQRIRDLAGTVTVREYEAAYAGLRLDPSLLPAELAGPDHLDRYRA